jgi:hypothetical protein
MVVSLSPIVRLGGLFAGLAVACGLLLGADCDPENGVVLEPEPQAAQSLPEGDSEPTEASSPVEVPDPLTDLPLSLLATMAAEVPENGRATFRDEVAGVIATYRVGELVREGVALAEVGPAHVTFDRAGRRERLEFDPEPVELRADDVFYPDLADTYTLPNSMADGVQLQPGTGYVVKTPGHAWGTPRVLAAIRDSVRAYHRSSPENPQVHVGDLSKKEGGFFPPHLSHQDGRDVDIGYVLKGSLGHERRFVTATRLNLDRERSWALIRALLDSQVVGYIFMDYELQRLLYDHALRSGEDPQWLASVFQYPHGQGASRGMIRHWRGHQNHFHVRFAR